MNRDSIEDIYELSPAQQGMLFQSLYARRPDMFLEQLSCELRGSLDAESFVQAWREVARRHPALRVSFHVDDLEKPLQVVHRDAEPAWQRLDWRAWLVADQEARFEELLAEDRAAGFALDRAPLMRLALIRVAEDRHWLVWSHHHLLMDGWSLPIVMAEVFALYRGLAHGSPVQLPPRRPYSDFIGFLQAQDNAALASFWRDYLDGLDSPFMLTAGVVAPEAADATGAGYGEHAVALGTAATDALIGLARDRRVTLGAILRGAWALLVGRIAGRDDVVFGTTVSGRPAGLTDADTIVGPFINTLPVRMRIPSQGSLFDWLDADAASRTAWRAGEHVSAAQIIEWTGLPPGRPLFDSIVVFGNYPMERGAEQRADLQVERVRVSGGRTGHPLVLMADPGPRLALRLVFDRRVCDAGLAERIVGHLRGLLETIAVAPDRALAELATDVTWARARVAELRAAGQSLPRPPYVAPRNEIEEGIAGVWAALLEVDRVGVDDDYFELGGHSLLAARILARLREIFQVELPIHLLFTRRLTVAGLAETVAEHLIAQADSADLATAMQELDGMSDEEVRKLLASEGR